MTGQVVLLAVAAVALVTAGEEWGPAARIAGAALVITGAVLAFLGLVTLGGSLTPFPEPLPNAALVERGIYRRVRHPIYGGIGLGSLGAGVFDGNPPAIWAAAALLTYLWAKTGYEEGRLLDHYPDYAEYRNRVHSRLIPWVF